MFKWLLSITVFCLCLLFVNSTPIFAQAGLTVSPTLSEATLVPRSNNSTSFLINIRNISDSLKTYEVWFRDFLPNRDGTPQIMPIGETPEKYGLAQYMEGEQSLTLRSGQSKIYQLQVSIPDDIDLGTYYGAVAFMESASGNDVSGAIKVASLVVVDVGESLAPSLSIDNFELSSDSLDDPGDKAAMLALTLDNAGSFAVEPEVRVAIVDGDGKTLTTLEPEKTGYVLPQSKRDFTFLWSPDSFDEQTDYYAVPHVSLEEGGEAGGDAERILIHAAAVGETTESTEADTAWWPWLTAAGVVVVLGLGGFMLWQRAQRRNETTQQTAPTPGEGATISNSISSQHHLSHDSDSEGI